MGLPDLRVGGGQGGDAAGGGGLVQRAVSDDERRWGGSMVGPVSCRAFEMQPVAVRRLDEGILVAVIGKADEQVQAGGDARGGGGGEAGRDRVDERVASGMVDRAHPTQMAAQVAAVDEAGEGDLSEGLGPEVVEGLGGEKVAEEMLGGGEPAES